MNDWKLALTRIEELIKETETNLDLAARAGIYAAARVILNDLSEHIVEELSGPNHYAGEKIGGIKWHIGAALGFDVDNGHSASQHRAWAYGDLNSLKATLERTLTAH